METSADPDPGLPDCLKGADDPTPFWSILDQLDNRNRVGVEVWQEKVPALLNRVILQRIASNRYRFGDKEGRFYAPIGQVRIHQREFAQKGRQSYWEWAAIDEFAWEWARFECRMSLTIPTSFVPDEGEPLELSQEYEIWSGYQWHYVDSRSYQLDASIVACGIIAGQILDDHRRPSVRRISAAISLVVDTILKDPEVGTECYRFLSQAGSIRWSAKRACRISAESFPLLLAADWLEERGRIVVASQIREAIGDAVRFQDVKLI